MVSIFRRNPFPFVVILFVCLIFLHIFKNSNDYDSGSSISSKASGNNIQKHLQETSKKSTENEVRTVIIDQNHYKKRLLGYFAYTEQQLKSFDDLVKRKAGSKDKELIDFVREVMDPPSSKRMVKMSRPLMKTPQAEEIEKILKNKTNGFFVEAGGLDGERSSNTIYFEARKQWTGLLVEADSFFYTQLMGKNRNAWSINACISSQNYISKMTFRDDSGGAGSILEKDLKSLGSSLSINTVPCFPLHTMLLALNRSHVDFFSLDVEGFEIPVLKTIPFDEISISTIAVEYGHGVKSEYTELMSRNGFHLHMDIHTAKPEFGLYVEDYIFVRNDTLSLS